MSSPEPECACGIKTSMGLNIINVCIVVLSFIGLISTFTGAAGAPSLVGVDAEGAATVFITLSALSTLISLAYGILGLWSVRSLEMEKVAMYEKATKAYAALNLIYIIVLGILGTIGGTPGWLFGTIVTGFIYGAFFYMVFRMTKSFQRWLGTLE